MKTMQPCDWDEKDLERRFANGEVIGLQPKIDGVRAHNPYGGLLARSNKLFKNGHTTAFFSRPEYQYIDGELAAGDERDPRLCSLTTSAVNTIAGQPFLLWHAFDLLRPDVLSLPYDARYHMLKEHVANLQRQALATHLRVVPMQYCKTMAELLYWDSLWSDVQGYEGSIVRKLDSLHKSGRATVKQGQVLRIKRFVEEEAIVDGILEGFKNMNPAQINELGRTFRSSHHGNMIPNGMVGSFQCTIINDSELFKSGEKIVVATGPLTDDELIDYFEHPHKIVGQTIKFKHFPKGVKDKPRFPQFQSIRAEEDR